MPLSIDAYSMIYDASERVRKTIAPHWSAMAKYEISWPECQTFLSTIENDLQTLSLAAASSDTPLPTVHMMTVLNLVSLTLIPNGQDLPVWALDHHRINDFKRVIKTVAGTKAFSWNTPLPRNQYGALPDPYDIPLLDEDDVAPPVVPQPAPSVPGPSHTNASSTSINPDPTDDSGRQSVDRQIADRASTAPAPPKPRMRTKLTTARPSNLQGEPSVVIYRKPTQQPVIETPREPTPKPLEVSTPKPVEDKSGEDAAAPDDSLALRRTPRAAARTKEALDMQVNNSRKRPREPSSEVDGEYKNSNIDSSDEESLAVATKKQRQSRDTTTSSKASSSKDAGSSKKTSTVKTAAGGSSKKTTAKQDANKKKPAVKKARTPAPSKIDKGKRKAVSENPESEEVDAEPRKTKPDYDLPGKVVDSAFLRGRMALVTADFKKLETPPGFSGLETLPYLTPAEYIANDTQNTRLFPSRPGRAASTNEKDYPDVFIASHRLGAGYSLKDLVETTRNIGAVRQIVADHKVVTCAACAAGAHTKTCVPMGVGLPCVACRGSGIPCSLNSELDRLEVSSRTGYEVFAQCSPVIANQLRRINATTSSFVTASGLADSIKFNLGSEVAVLRNLLSNPARVFHQLKAVDANLKITPDLVSGIGQLAGWTVSYKVKDIEDFLAQPAPADDATFHPVSAAASEITTVPPLHPSNFFLPVGNKPTPIDISQWAPFMDAQNPMRPAVNSALEAGEQYPMIVLPPEEVSVSDVAVPTAVHPASTRDSPVHETTPSISMPIPTIEESQSRDDSFDEASSRDEEATKTFEDQFMRIGTPESFLHSSLAIRSSPPIAVLSQEKDEDNQERGDDDDEEDPEEKDVEDDLMDQIDSSPIRPSTTH
ncbi:hypothetical protein K435DRAFT_812702 [Dendrothele bispora CBS 962.96]|uniref:Uncharacterized protein n=1 Tax=Dendrothele bispora (strain CBS 962.96) TaxID=1314807 RepID=A0A4V4HAX3_DENBC|nr:hypothetical protein K435DRAFT_812702 [Dendrothele bispora CBS 962.96]